MATHDYIISNASGAAVRADLNNALAAIVTNNSSATAPTTTYAYQWWADTGSSPAVMKLRNAANSAWITLFQLDGEWTSIAFENGTAAAPSIYFKDSGTDTGIYSPGTDQVAISTAGSQRITIDALGRFLTGSASSSGNGCLIQSRNDSTGLALELQRSSDNANSPGLFFAKSRGTQSSPTEVLTGDQLGVISFTGYDGVSYKDSAYIYAEADADWTTSGDTTDNPSRLLFATTADGAGSPTERARIDSSGRLLVGATTARSNFYNASTISGLLQIEGTTDLTRTFSQVHNTTDSKGSLYVLAKSRGATVGSNTVVQSGDQLGEISFQGSDGTEFVAAAAIEAQIDGTPGANDMPGRLIFSTTADGTSTPKSRFIIPNGGASSFWANDSVFNASSGGGAGLTNSVFTGWYGGTGPESANLGTISVRIFTNGNVQNTNNSYGALSDIKLKENIIDANSQWDDIKALHVRNYNFKEGQTHTQIGLIAQEAELVSPGLVSESPDRDEEGNDLGTTTKSVNYSVLYMKAVKALQEAMERIEALEAKVAALEAA